ncbi:MAG: TonB C-terminal domain-containing protein [Candidatus Hydrogenedens sp.]|nr:TonB C-terminal domain-containing protein [Candidatus Hydrogenedens sp.]
MQWLYQEYWNRNKESKQIKKAFIISILIHILIFIPFYFYKFRTPEPIPLVFQVSLENPVPEKPITQEPPPEPPKPEPPKPEPPKPEPPKPEPPKPEPKPEPPKPEPKPEKKPEPPKPKPEPEKKPEPPKPKPEPEKKPVEKKEKIPPTPPAPKAEVATPLPPELEWWARQVQRKIESVWVVPEGIKIDPENNVAEVSFWVNRQGQLIETPRVTKEASDPELGESGIRAILLAAPFPRFPDGFAKDEQLVVYAFSLQ